MSANLDLQKIAAGVDLVQLCERLGIRMRKAGQHKFSGLCPFHQEKTPSFNVSTGRGKQTYRCFGCGAHGDGIDFLMNYYNTDLKGALSYINGRQADPVPQRINGLNNGVRGDGDAVRQQKARTRIVKIWKSSYPASGSLVETYLKNRGIDVSALGGLPECLRYAPEVEYWHFCKRQGKAERLGVYPAMIAPIKNMQGAGIGLHVTYLDRNDAQKLQLPIREGEDKRPPSKKVFGKMARGIVPLYQSSSSWCVTEGIENALHSRILWPDYGIVTSISLSNMRSIEIPYSVDDVRIVADNDMKRTDNKKDPREQIKEAAHAYRNARIGRKVVITWPPEGDDLDDTVNRLNKNTKKGQ